MEDIDEEAPDTLDTFTPDIAKPEPRPASISVVNVDANEIADTDANPPLDRLDSTSAAAPPEPKTFFANSLISPNVDVSPEDAVPEAASFDDLPANDEQLDIDVPGFSSSADSPSTFIAPEYEGEGGEGDGGDGLDVTGTEGFFDGEESLDFEMSSPDTKTLPPHGWLSYDKDPSSTSSPNSSPNAQSWPGRPGRPSRPDPRPRPRPRPDGPNIVRPGQKPRPRPKRPWRPSWEPAYDDVDTSKYAKKPIGSSMGRPEFKSPSEYPKGWDKEGV